MRGSCDDGEVKRENQRERGTERHTQGLKESKLIKWNSTEPFETQMSNSRRKLALQNSVNSDYKKQNILIKEIKVQRDKFFN